MKSDILILLLSIIVGALLKNYPLIATVIIISLIIVLIISWIVIKITEKRNKH